MIRDAADRQEKVDALTERYRLGEISETVYRVSLSFFIPEHEIKFLVDTNQVFYRNSLPFKQGIVQ